MGFPDHVYITSLPKNGQGPRKSVRAGGSSGVSGSSRGGPSLLFPFLTQAIRVLGLLGALDPYKHKVNIGMIDQSRDASAVSLSESKSSQDSCKWKGALSLPGP